MTVTPLSLAVLQKAQAEAEGFQNGPAPALNPANINTQDNIGNPQVTGSSPVPYYPSSETPNLQLSTEDMSSTLANNFVILDTAAGNGLLSSVTLLTAAQISSLLTTPVTLVPAPGAGLYIVPLTMAITYYAGTVPWRGGNSIEIGNPGGLAGNTYAGYFQDPAAVFGTDAGTGNILSLTNFAGQGGLYVQEGLLVNQPLIITQSGAWTQNGNGTGKVTVIYAILTA
jgi:hypothetical protein